MATRVRLYKQGKLVSEDFPLEAISDHLQDPHAVIWLDISESHREEIKIVSEEFGLHDLAIEDALHEHQRAKLDRYDQHLFLAAYDVALNKNTGKLATNEVAAFITKQALITVRKDGHFDIEDVVRRWDASPDLATNGVGFLLWGLLDHIVDGHFAAVQQLDDNIETLEDILFDERRRRSENMQRRAYESRKSLVALRRVVLPMREVINTLFRRDLDIVTGDMQPYYQDVYDHVLRVSEWTESLRDMVSTIFETQLSLQDTRLNEIMKKLTAYAAIIAVPTAVTGFYGQNVPYPGFQQHAGFVASAVVMVVIGVGLFVAFKRNDWL
jgi:magnesium transporter